jgi:hypothetical protein
MAAGTVAAGWLGAARGSEPWSTLLRVGQPIEAADRTLRGSGWRPAPDRQPDELDRARAGNRLESLSACSGSGLGYCRYDYRRGRDGLTVITVPTPSAGGGGSVLRWSEPGSGRSWGLCLVEGGARLRPCAGR